jgi:hypothetical protein
MLYVFRTDNAIKNHFYSKLRKFIRKILKSINKDNLLKTQGVDPSKYNSDKIYKMIKKYKIPYNTLTKESILTMIVNYEKNAKVGKGVEQGFLKNKTARKKTKEKENLYSEKINKRAKRHKESFNNIYLPKRRSARAQRARKRKDYEDSIYEFGGVGNTRKDLSLNLLGANRLKKEYEQDAEYIESLNNIENNGETENGNTDNGDNGNNLNIIIDKSILFNNYVKEEEEKSRIASGVPSAEKSEKQEFVFDNVYNVPLYTGGGVGGSDNLLLFNKYPFDYYTIDYHQPLISPINYRTQIFPMSTKNHFNIDMMIQPYDYSGVQRTYLRSPACVEKYINKEINMQNRVLINEANGGDKFKAEDLFVTSSDDVKPSDEGNKTTEQQKDETTSLDLERKPSRKRLSLDLDMVNKTDTNQFFANSFIEAQKEETPVIVTPAESSTTGANAITPHNEQGNIGEDGKKSLLPTSPPNMRTDFSVSPKSAFRIRK